MFDYVSAWICIADIQHKAAFGRVKVSDLMNKQKKPICSQKIRTLCFLGLLEQYAGNGSLNVGQGPSGGCANTLFLTL